MLLFELSAMFLGACSIPDKLLTWVVDIRCCPTVCKISGDRDPYGNNQNSHDRPPQLPEKWRSPEEQSVQVHEGEFDKPQAEDEEHCQGHLMLSERNDSIWFGLCNANDTFSRGKCVLRNTSVANEENPSHKMGEIVPLETPSYMVADRISSNSDDRCGRSQYP